MGKRSQGTCIKDAWTKPKRGRMEGGDGDGWGAVVGVKQSEFLFVPSMMWCVINEQFDISIKFHYFVLFHFIVFYF